MERSEIEVVLRCENDVQFDALTVVSPQATQGHYVWVRASEVIWSEYTRILSVLSDAK